MMGDIEGSNALLPRTTISQYAKLHQLRPTIALNRRSRRQVVKLLSHIPAENSSDELSSTYDQDVASTPPSEISVERIAKLAIPAVGIWLCSPLLSVIDTSAVGLLSGTLQQAALNPAVAVTDYSARCMVSPASLQEVDVDNCSCMYTHVTFSLPSHFFFIVFPLYRHYKFNVDIVRKRFAACRFAVIAENIGGCHESFSSRWILHV